MKLSFTKMTGAGNDFVVLDNRDLALKLSGEQIARLCDRHFGVGADGLLAVEPGVDGADFRMRYYNSDGGEAEMCGNGARCFARYARAFKSATASNLSFDTPAGRIHARFVGNDVEVNLTAPQGLDLGRKISIPGGTFEVHSVNTGVPHAVIFVDDLEKTPIVEWGRPLRRHEAFAPKGTNVNFVHVEGSQRIAVRTYERGVEDETLACGTGVTAAGIIAHIVRGLPLPVEVRVRSGAVLAVNFKRDGSNFTDVTLRGPAEVCFTGEIELPL